MLCDECGQREATLHLMAVVNGKKTERHLCSVCAEKSHELEAAAGLKPDALLSAILKHGGEDGRREADSRVCSCGMTLERFHKEGRLGCPECYKTFGDVLVPMLQRLHGASAHSSGRLQPSVQDEPAPADEKPAESAIDALKRELREAIELENYEQAAVLRDRIREKEAAENDGFMA